MQAGNWISGNLYRYCEEPDERRKLGEQRRRLAADQPFATGLCGTAQGSYTDPWYIENFSGEIDMVFEPAAKSEETGDLQTYDPQRRVRATGLLSLSALQGVAEVDELTRYVQRKLAHSCTHTHFLMSTQT